MENSIFWAGGNISGSNEGLTLDLFANILEKFELRSFLDGGANSGTFGLTCLGLDTTVKQVVFAEPLPKALSILKDNLALNQCVSKTRKRYLIFEGALSDSDGLGELFLDPNKDIQFSASIVNNFHINNQASIQIKCNKLSTLIKRHRLIPPDIVKFDVEGAEYSTLLGFEEYLQEVKFLFIEILNNKRAKQLSKLFNASKFMFIDINDRADKLELMPNLRASSYRNILIFRREFRREIDIYLQETARKRLAISKRLGR